MVMNDSSANPKTKGVLELGWLCRDVTNQGELRRRGEGLSIPASVNLWPQLSLGEGSPG